MTESPRPELGEIPEFLREALGPDVPWADSVEVLGELVLAEPAPRAGADRLLAEVERLPLRYAPFFDRLSELWDLSEPEVRLALQGAADAAGWRKPLFPGVELFELEGGPRRRGASVKLVRFAPGLGFPSHRHAGDETVFVLEGSYTDSSGCRVGPGDVQRMTAGSEHALSIAREGPCVAALVEHGVEFTGLFLRTLQRWFDR